MSFEKTTVNNTVMPTNWTNCENCDPQKSDKLWSDYHKRSSQTAAELNVANNGKSCASA